MRTAAEVNIGSPDAYAQGVPHEVFSQLRRDDPVAWIDEPAAGSFAGGPGFWAVTRYADVATVSRNPEVFSSHSQGTFLRDQRPRDLAALQQMMLNMDPPEHGRLRSIVGRVFTPRAVERMMTGIYEHAHAVVSALPPDAEIDLVERVAAEMPLRVLADVLGVVPEDRHLLYDWTNRMVGLDDPTYGGRAQYVSAFAEMFEYSARQTSAKRAHPGSDLWSLIVNAELDGAQLTTEELNRFFQLLVIAGNETTRNLLTGVFLVLDEFTEQRAQLQKQPQLLPTAIEEVLRYRPPVIQFRRTVTRDTALGGRRLAAGDKVVIFYVSANRDELQFERPEEFRFDRTGGHLAFGVGTHFCLGGNLARAEVRALLEVFFARFPHWRVTGTPDRLRSNFIDGIKSLAVHTGSDT